MISYTNIQETVTGTEPVSRDEAKAWARVDFPDDDDWFDAAVTGARETVEKFTNLALIDKSVTFDVQTTEINELVTLPYVTNALSIDITDIDDDDSALDADEYTLRGPGVKVGYAGNFGIAFDIDASPVPQALKEAIMMEVAERYNNRGENQDTTGLSKGAKEKAFPYQIPWH